MANSQPNRCSAARRRWISGVCAASAIVAFPARANAQAENVNVADVLAPSAERSAVERSVADFSPQPAAPETPAKVRTAAPRETRAKKRTVRDRIFSGEGWKRPEASKRLRNAADNSGLRFEFDSEVVADDNILYSAAGEEVSDVIFRFRPGVFFDLGEEGSGADLFASVAYRPTASFFVENDSENSVDHDFAVRFGAGGEKFQSTFDAGYQTLSEASVDVGQRTDRDVVSAGAVMEYAVGGRTGIRTELGYERADYDVFAGFDEWRADVYATYEVGAKTNLGLGYGYGQLRPDKQATQDYQRALVRGDWQATPKLAVAAWGGADFRTGGGGDETTAVFGIELTGDLREGTRIRLAAGRDIGASALIDTETFTFTRYTVAIEQRVGERFTGVFEVGFEDYDYTGGGELGTTRSDKSISLRPALRYRLRDELTAEIFYAFRDSDSSINLLDFESNQFGASVHYAF